MQENPLSQSIEVCKGLFRGDYGSFWELVTIAFFVAFITIFVRWICKLLHIRWERERKVWQDAFITALYKPLSVFAIIVGSLELIDWIFESIECRHLFPSKRLLWSITFIGCLAWFLLRWKNRIVHLLGSAHPKNRRLDKARIDVVGKLLTIIIIFIAIVLVLDITGHSISALIAFGGVGGLAIAFASQEIISNFFSGFMIYINRPFAVGDWVVIPEHHIEGHIEEIGWHMTSIRGLDKKPIYLSNSLLSKVVIINPGRMGHREFIHVLSLRVEDFKRLHEITQAIEDILFSHPLIDKHEKIIVALEKLGDFSLDVKVRAYTQETDTVAFAKLQHELLSLIIETVFEKGGDFANPTTRILLSKEEGKNP